MLQDIKIIIRNRAGLVVSVDNQYEYYSFDTQYGAVADAFSLTLADNDADIEEDYSIEFLIDNIVRFKGIIQRKERMTSKQRSYVKLSGKDRAAILVESYCTRFKDFNNDTPVDIIDNLINQTNFYTKQKGSVEESEDNTDFNNDTDIDDHNTAILADTDNSKTISTLTDKTIYDAEFTALAAKKHFKINVGDRVFNKINILVKSYGYEILYQENGTLYIGDLSKKRYADPVVYSLIHRRNGVGNNVETANFTKDNSGRYSTVSVTSQSEGYRYSAEFPHVNKEKIALDSTLEIIKYMAMNYNDSDSSPEKIAIQTREDQRINGYQLIYEVPGHKAGNGEVWKINRLANVYDDINKIYRHLVIYGRTFIYSQRAGTGTRLRLSHEKLNALEI